MEDYDTSNGVHCALKFIGGEIMLDLLTIIYIIIVLFVFACLDFMFVMYLYTGGKK